MTAEHGENNMNRLLILYILASLLFLAPSYAAESGSAMAQLDDLYPGQASVPVIEHILPMPDSNPCDPLLFSPGTPQTGLCVPQWDFPGPSEFPMPNTTLTEDCSLQYGVEICIAPNWPDCEANGDVEPCIDHVQNYCSDGSLPLWASFNKGGRWHQGCYTPVVSYPEAAGAKADKADENKILMRAGVKGLTVILGGRNIHFPVRGGEEKSHRGYFPGYTSANSWQEFLDNDPCHGLMACYNPANAALVNEILNAYSADPNSSARKARN